MTTERVIARFRAGLKLIYPDDITPMGRRMLEKILDEEAEIVMQVKTVTVAYTIGDLAGLPVGSRIATNDNKLLGLDELPSGATYWIEPGQGVPYQPLVHWLPAIILPPVVDHKSDSLDAGAVPPK